jgi:DNA-binding NtrC family response regulator
MQRLTQSEEGTRSIAILSQDANLIEVIGSALSPGYTLVPITEQDCEDGSVSSDTTDVLLFDISSGYTYSRKPEAILESLLAHSVPVIIMADDGSRREALELETLGAQGSVRKPPALRELKIVLQRACADRRPIPRQPAMGTAETVTQFNELVGGGAQMQMVYRLVRKVADFDASVLIMGESGTGKELIARAIHSTGSRSRRPFVAVSCSAIPDTLIEAELFGHEKGAFTGTVGTREGYLEKAGDGTLFLDEIGELNPQTQVALLRVLQQREFSRLGSSRLIPLRARIVFATHRDLSQMVVTKEFREDLFYRINVMKIEAPALRRHPEDIPFLVNHFIRKYSEAYRKPVEYISTDALAVLGAHSWPGNVRELENVIQRAVIMAEEETIQAGDLTEKGWALDSCDDDAISDDDQAGSTFERLLHDYKIRLATEAIRHCHGNKTLAAQSLSISRAYLHRLIRPGSGDGDPSAEEAEGNPRPEKVSGLSLR